jgi:hypothetical protein
MTAHWGVPDPAAVEGAEETKVAAFREATRILLNRIRIFTSLHSTNWTGCRCKQGCARSARRVTSLPRRCAAEAIGTALLLAAVVGSGIMGERLAAGNAAIALLANSLATASSCTC